MDFGTPLAVLVAIVFLSPGFIWRKVADLFQPYAKARKLELLECFMLSCVNYLVTSPMVYLLLRNLPAEVSKTPSEINTYLNHAGYFFAWFIPVFAFPVLGGFLTAKVMGWRKGVSFLRKFGVSILHPAPTAWDYAFARNQKYWARIELTDGEIVEGLFDSNSHASTEPEERDVFLEAAFEFNEKTQIYEPVARNAGVYVRGESIKTILFFFVDESGRPGAPVDKTGK